MNILSVENLSKSLGLRKLFQGLSFGISRGEKVALVARNGVGKTTLLRILGGLDTADSGTVAFQKDTRIAFLQQEPEIPVAMSLEEAVYAADNPLLKVIREYELALHNAEDHKALGRAMDAMEANSAWDYEQRIRQILTELKLSDLSISTSSLSGGQRKRLALALALIQEPDFLIMDEPTNHLDLEMIEWLEEYLATRDLTLLMVTHDRYFLDRVCGAILEIDGGQLYRYNGNFTYFTEKKAERMFAQEANVEKAKNLYRKELEWMRRQPKARTTKSKSRIDAFYDIETRASQRIQEKQVKLDVQMSRLGRKILEISHLKKAFPGKIIAADFSFVFKQRDRIGIVGDNGTGKTTFLKMITGQIQPDAGLIDVGETIVFGYYTQDGMVLTEDKRVIEVVKDIAEFLPVGKNKVITASQLLERFLFAGDQQYTLISKLSGGERRRLYLCTILIKNPNFLILDEPTNDLDIQTLAVLEDFLEDFPGCLVVVSHDRYFMDKLVDHLFVFEGQGKIRDYYGNYSDFREEVAETELKEAYVRKTVTAAVSSAKPVLVSIQAPATHKEKQAFEQLIKEIADLEKRRAAIYTELDVANLNQTRITELSRELQLTNHDLEARETTWLEMSDRFPNL